MEPISEHIDNSNLDFSNKTVLLVEDEEPYRRFLSKIIEKYLKSNVYSCTNPKEAFEYLQNNSPNLIIMDLQMPFMDGLTALKYIRASEKTSKIPVIICSSLGFESIIKTMSIYNVAEFILKPGDAQVILKKIAKVFKDSEQS